MTIKMEKVIIDLECTQHKDLLSMKDLNMLKQNQHKSLTKAKNKICFLFIWKFSILIY